MTNTEITRIIDDLGRVTIPKTLRDKCGFEQGQKVEFCLTEIDGEEYICFKCPRPSSSAVTKTEE